MSTLTYVILGVSVLLIGMTYLFFVAGAATSSNIYAGTVSIPCAPGQCPTNIFNGEKRCPLSPTEILYSNPEIEVCNSPYLCDNPSTPYAVMSDGSTNIQGICGELPGGSTGGFECRCLSHSQCPEYIVTSFNTTSGNPYVPATLGSNNQRLLFTQSGYYLAPGGGGQSPIATYSNVPPIVFSDPTVTFCTVPLEWLNRSVPGCTSEVEMNQAAICRCMALEAIGEQGGPTSSFSSPCILGTLAFVPNNVELFDEMTPEDFIQQTPLACVRGKPCIGSGEVALWDNQLGQVLCKTLCSN